MNSSMENARFEVRFLNEEKGKGLFALTSFKEGDTIFDEEPLVCCQFAWNKDYKYLACSYCLKPLETAEENARRLTGNLELVLPFSDCCETKKNLITKCELCGEKYCSSDCKEKAWQKFHHTLCVRSQETLSDHPLIQLKETWKQMHYPPETATIMLLARMIAMVNQAPDKTDLLNKFSQFCSRTASDSNDLVHNLLGEKFVGQIDVLCQMLQKSVDTESLPHWFTEEGFRSLLALVGTNGQGIGTSSFGRWVKNVSSLYLPDDQRISVDKLIDHIYEEMDEVVGTFLNNEGSGLYSVQSSINHSCSPNAEVEFPNNNNILRIKALKDIQENEEICIFYLDDCHLERSRYSRQKLLSSHYLFICKCIKCEQQINDLDATSDEDLSEDD